MDLRRLNSILDKAIELSGIDLGKTCEPISCPTPAPEAPKKYYPSIYIDRDDDATDAIPDEGEATIKYKVRSRSKSEYDGKKTRSVTIDVLSIDPETEDDEEDSKELAAKAIGALHELVSIRVNRDDMGRFQAGQTGGTDPLTMKQAYAPRIKTAGLIAAGAGAAKFGPGLIQSGARMAGRKMGNLIGRGVATGKVATPKMKKKRDVADMG